MKTVPVSLFNLDTVAANSINHRIATVKGGLPNIKKQYRNSRQRNQCHQPLILLLHGWPESWYSWRHQLLCLSNAGYHVCAPDMRGYGGTDAPTSVLEYTIDTLCLDVIEISKALGYDKIIVIGHDFGSYLAWHLALLYPLTVVGVVGMSVPYIGHKPTSEPNMIYLQKKYGFCLPSSSETTRDEQNNAKFHYMLLHNLPGIANEYNKNVYETLYRIYSYKLGVDSDPPEITDKRMFPPSYCNQHEKSRSTSSLPSKVKGSTSLLYAMNAPGWWTRLPRPKSLPTWLSKSDLDYLVEQYRYSGFDGGLKWYQVLDANWYLSYHRLRYDNDRSYINSKNTSEKNTNHKKIYQKAMFMIGDEDRNVIANHGNDINVILKEVKMNILNLYPESRSVVIDGGGHWIQQERHQEVNRDLLRFLKSFDKDGMMKSEERTKEIKIFSKL